MKSPNWECIEKLNCKISEQFSDFVLIGSQKIHFNAISVSLNGFEVNAAGVSKDPVIAEWKAYGECVERIIGVQKLKNLSEVTPNYRLAISNGMAAHTNLMECIQRSRSELIERNSILKSWTGKIESPRQEKLYPKLLTNVPLIDYSKKLYLIAETECQGERYFTYAAFLFPLNPKFPLVYGFGCAQDAENAASSAVDEALQRYIFLKDETDFTGEVDPTLVNNPMFHQEFYLKTENHTYIREWVENGSGRIPKIILGTDVKTDILLAGDPLYVTRSHSNECESLYFGKFKYERGSYFNSRCEVHPIP